MPQMESQRAGDAVAAQLRQMAGSAKQLRASAQSGGFGFQPQAAETMIKALRDSILDLDGLNYQLIVISQAPKLGHTPAAQKVSPFTQSVATDDQGIVPMIHNLKQILSDMIAAYEAAKQSYEQSDTRAAQHSFR
jgi:hypothetical protein